MKSLYRKWRPLKLADVVGQEQVTTPLSNAIEQNKFSHAYLFTGPRGTGKTSVARIFAHAVNNFDYELEDDYVDIIEIDGASNRGIENIREIREKAAIKPTLGKYKVYIVDEVHMLTREAFNALLKTLEEPPEHVIFIMATTDAHKVPVTITSRAQTYNFKLVAPETITKHLEMICEKEGIRIERPALELITRRGGGSFRDSLSLLDQISSLDKDLITRKMIEEAFGLPEDVYIDDLITSYAAGDVVKITTLLKDLYSAGVKAEILAEEIIGKIIEKPEPVVLPLLGKLPEVKAPFAEAKLLYILASVNSGAAVGGAGNSATPRMPVSAPVAPQTSQAPVKPAALGSALARPAVQSPVSARQETMRPARPWEAIASRTRNAAKPDLKSKLSDIMGGEVQDYGGGSPF